jgi:hypothetical protein
MIAGDQSLVPDFRDIGRDVPSRPATVRGIRQRMVCRVRRPPSCAERLALDATAGDPTTNL